MHWRLCPGLLSTTRATPAWTAGLDYAEFCVLGQALDAVEEVLQPPGIGQVPIKNDDYSTVFGEESSRPAKKPGRDVQVAGHAAMKIKKMTPITNMKITSY